MSRFNHNKHETLKKGNRLQLFDSHFNFNESGEELNVEV